jgi:hypothetical protein
MPVVVTATVMRWAVNRAVNPAVVEFHSSDNVSMFMGDGTNNADVSPIIANYILTTAANNQQMQAELLAAARDGLLQVVNPQRITVTLPSVPPVGPAAQPAAAGAAQPAAGAAQPAAGAAQPAAGAAQPAAGAAQPAAGAAQPAAGAAAGGGRYP